MKRESFNGWSESISTDFAILILFPIIHVLVSERSHGGAKFGWFLAVFIFSWLGYIAFLITTQKAKDMATSNSDM